MRSVWETNADELRASSIGLDVEVPAEKAERHLLEQLGDSSR